jgi:hypothetical protein
MPGSEFIAEAQMNALRKMMEPDDVDQHRSFGCFALDAARSGIGDRKCRKYNFRQELLAKRGKANRAGPNGYLATRPKICVRLWSGILATRTGTECRRFSLALSRRSQVPLVPPTADLCCWELSDAAAPAIANLSRRLDGIALLRTEVIANCGSYPARFRALAVAAATQPPESICPSRALRFETNEHIRDLPTFNSPSGSVRSSRNRRLR